MKKITTTLICMLFALLNADLALASCTPQAATGAPGVTPPTENLACIEVGIPYNEVIYIENFGTFNTAFGTATLNYLTIDSITNLPCDLTWEADRPNRTYLTSELGCVSISGTTNDNVGQYRVKIYITVEVDAPILGVITLQDEAEALVQQVEGLTGQPTGVNFKYFLRVINPGAACPVLDTTASATNLAACAPAPSPVEADFTISNNNPCEGVDFTVDAVVTGNGVAPYTYEWSPSNLFSTPSAATSTVNIGTAGTTTLTLKVFDSNGDSAVVNKDVEVDVCVGINNSSASNFSIYPNPSNGEFTVKGNYSGEAVNVAVFSLDGREVYANNFSNAAQTLSAKINLSNLQKGIYILKVSSENNISYNRISIQ